MSTICINISRHLHHPNLRLGSNCLYFDNHITRRSLGFEKWEETYVLRTRARTTRDICRVIKPRIGFARRFGYGDCSGLPDGHGCRSGQIVKCWRFSECRQTGLLLPWSCRLFIHNNAQRQYEDEGNVEILDTCANVEVAAKRNKRHSSKMLFSDMYLQVSFA